MAFQLFSCRFRILSPTGNTLTELSTSRCQSRRGEKPSSLSSFQASPPTYTPVTAFTSTAPQCYSLQVRNRSIKINSLHRCTRVPLSDIVHFKKKTLLKSVIVYFLLLCCIRRGKVESSRHTTVRWVQEVQSMAISTAVRKVSFLCFPDLCFPDLWLSV